MRANMGVVRIRYPVRLLVAAVGCGVLLLSSAAAAPADTTPAPNDPYFSEQWNLVRIGAPAAWTRGTGAGITVGVVDTGVDLGHEDLAGKIVASTNCVGANDDASACHGSAQDNQGHGTHVSGIIAAATNNHVGVAGVAPGARILVAKALQGDGSGALNDVNAGIKWVVDHGAKIVNLSIEADSGAITVLPGQSLAEGVDYAWAKGAVAVVAAGNSTPSLIGGGRSFADVNALVVGATGRRDEVAFYSSPLGTAKWGLVAPGGDARGPDGKPSCTGVAATECIVSTGWFPGMSNQYADDEGTSMAAPHVAGVLALLMGQGPGLSREAAIARVLDSAAKVACGTGCHGRLDAAAAVRAPGPPSTTAPPPHTAATAPVSHPPSSPPASTASTPTPDTRVTGPPPPSTITEPRKPSGAGTSTTVTPQPVAGATGSGPAQPPPDQPSVALTTRRSNALSRSAGGWLSGFLAVLVPMVGLVVLTATFYRKPSSRS